MDKYQLDTLAVRAGTTRSQFGEHSEAMYLTSSYVFKSAAQAAERFAGKEPGNVYSRFTNPTVAMFQDRLAALEGADACVATASGMSAILTTAMTVLKAGDHVSASFVPSCGRCATIPSTSRWKPFGIGSISSGFPSRSFSARARPTF